MNDVFKQLQEKAEELLSGKSVLQRNYSHAEFDKLMHDLQVHHIELQLQNEDLLATQKMLEESRNRYALLYNQAPVGYLTIDSNGIITQSNDTFVQLKLSP